MRKTTLIAFALLCATSLSCGGRSPTAPPAPAAESRLEVFVQWQGRGVADRRLEILELGLAQTTDSRGIAVFRLPAGSYTLRAFVNRPGPPVPTNIGVTLRSGETRRVEVPDCVLCMNGRRE